MGFKLVYDSLSFSLRILHDLNPCFAFRFIQCIKWAISIYDLCYLYELVMVFRPLFQCEWALPSYHWFLMYSSIYGDFTVEIGILTFQCIHFVSLARLAQRIWPFQPIWTSTSPFSMALGWFPSIVLAFMAFTRRIVCIYVSIIDATPKYSFNLTGSTTLVKVPWSRFHGSM